MSIIKQSDRPLATFRMDCNTKLALVICTAGILLFGVVSYVYEWIAAAAL